MKCPVCKLKLVRKRYEDVVIHACESCHGTLVKFNRLKVIESRRDKKEEQLIDELIHSTGDNPQKLRCLQCYSNMEKKTKQIGRSQFSIDRCQRCKHVWLDAGELAKLQVIYEFSEQGEEALRFRERLNNMTPAEKRELDERIASLPERTVEAPDEMYDNLRHRIIIDLLL